MDIFILIYDVLCIKSEEIDRDDFQTKSYVFIRLEARLILSPEWHSRQLHQIII